MCCGCLVWQAACLTTFKRGWKRKSHLFTPVKINHIIIYHMYILFFFNIHWIIIKASSSLLSSWPRFSMWHLFACHQILLCWHFHCVSSSSNSELVFVSVFVRQGTTYRQSYNVKQRHTFHFICFMCLSYVDMRVCLCVRVCLCSSDQSCCGHG